MRLCSSILFLCFYIGVLGQPETIKLGILPSEYGEGMPIEEFNEFEKNIIEHLEEIPRYEVVKLPEDYQQLDLDWNIQTRVDQLSKAGSDSNVPYLLQLVFGDTEWTGEAVGSPTPANNSGPWTQNAELWLTFNVYDVATGSMINSFTLTANSNEYPKFRTASTPHKMKHENAVNAGQKSLWKKSKQRIKALFPLSTSIQQIAKEDKKGVQLVRINAGSFHSLTEGDRLSVFYETPYLVRGTYKMRQVQVAKLKIISLEKEAALCEVKKGKDSIKPLLQEEKMLQCKLLVNDSTDYYGF